MIPDPLLAMAVGLAVDLGMRQQGSGTVTPPASGDALLLEDGTSFLLLESGDKLLLEA